MKRLIVTADDVGLHPAMTAGAIQGFRDGIVTACSVVANGVAFEEAIAELRKEPKLAVGVHLTFVGERPLLPPSEVKTLTTRTGRFASGYRSFVARYLIGGIELMELEHELRAQIERILTSGLRVTHVNSHQHLHLLPDIFELVVKLAIEYRIGYVRIVDDRGGRARLVRAASVRIVNALGRRASKWLDEQHHAGGRVRPLPFFNSRTTGVLNAGHLDEATMVELIEKLPEGITELVLHPGSENAALGDAYDWKYDWKSELAAVTAPRVRKAIESAGIVLMAPSGAATPA